MRRTRKHMISVSWWQTVLSMFLISFLIFFGNSLSLLAFNVQKGAQEVQEKLWIYFYLDDSITSKDALYTEVINLIEELKKENLEVRFFSKEKAFELLSARLPNVLGNLEKYGIENPLPPTVYVIFRNQTEYEILKDIILKYEDVIANMEDLEQGFTFSEQEQRVATVINILNVVRFVTYFLIAIVGITILSFLGYAIRLNFFRFRRQLEVEKLLGAAYRQIQAPFFMQIGAILLWWFALFGVYALFLYRYATEYFYQVFQRSLASAVFPEGGVGVFLLIEVVVVVLCAGVYSRVVLEKLLKEI